MTENLKNLPQGNMQERVKRGPPIGASVLLTFITGSMGLSTFRGLATLLLL